MKAAVLGAGMVGRAMAIDLSKKYIVTLFDINKANLDLLKGRNIETRIFDLSQYNEYPVLLAEFDIIISAVPGFMGYRALEAIILSGKNVADISFFPENALDLDGLAKEKNVTAIVDCGVAPGMSNLLLGYYNSQMNVKRFECMVGGLPKYRIGPFEYKAPFSPIDVIEEYIRPARYVENGHIVIKPALSDAELVDFEQVGTLESFNTDGLRSILFTMSHIPDMKEKTLRYPGHIDLISSLKKGGFFNTELISVKGTEIRPIDFTTSVLFDQWKLGENEPEFTIMKVLISGDQNGQPVSVEYTLYDEFDTVTETTSMSRTTGYTCTAMVSLVTDGLFTKKGIFPPELIGGDKNCFDFVLKFLAERNVIYTKKVSNGR